MKKDVRFVCVSLVVQNKSWRIGTMSIVFRRKQEKIPCAYIYYYYPSAGRDDGPSKTLEISSTVRP